MESLKKLPVNGLPKFKSLSILKVDFRMSSSKNHIKLV